MKKRVPYLDRSNGLWRIDDVPMVGTGISYPASTGPITFTEDDLADAVRAVNDVAIAAPRIKLGHRSDYNEPLIKDAEPAFGRWENLHLGDKGQTIYGDMVGMPEWLAKVVNVAFPNRSVEITHDAETVTGNRYDAVIHDCSVLGVKWPGCSVLPDLPLWYGSETPAEAEIDQEEGMKLFKKVRDKEGQVHAAVDVSLIRRKFYNDGPGAENAAWWVRGERFDSQDGYTLIVDMGDEELCRIPVTVDGDNPTFGEPVVLTSSRDKVVAASMLSGMAIADPEMVVYASRADTDPTQQEGGEQMDEATRQKLAKRLNLSADATAEQINERLAADALSTPTEEPETGTTQQPPGTQSPTPEEQGTPEGEPGTPGAGGQPEEEDDNGQSEASRGNGMVTLDRETYNMLKRGAEAGIRLETRDREGRVEAALTEAVKAGKIPPARREHYKKLLTADFEGTKAMLDSFEEGLIPVGERGSGGKDNEAGQTGESEGFPEFWFPEVKTIRANASRGGVVTNAKEG